MSPLPGRASAARELIALLRRNADYRRLFFATVISFMGDWFAFVAVSGFVTEVTGKGGLAAVVYAASVIPVFLMSPLAGAIADRVDRKKMLVTVDLVRVFPALLMIPAIAWDAPWFAIACVAVLAALSAFVEPIATAVVPNVVEPEDLSLAQTALGSVWGTMLFLGAAVGGLVSATLGREATFVLNAATFLDPPSSSSGSFDLFKRRTCCRRPRSSKACARSGRSRVRAGSPRHSSPPSSGWAWRRESSGCFPPMPPPGSEPVTRA